MASHDESHSAKSVADKRSGTQYETPFWNGQTKEHSVMKCEDYRDQIVLLAYGELRDEPRAELELHLHGCPECIEELRRMELFSAVLSTDVLPEVAPNLLTASRLRLDEALDEAERPSLMRSLMGLAERTWRHLAHAPALATFLIGAGFLGGNLLTRYQVAHTPHAPAPVLMQNDAEGRIANVSGIVQTPDPDVVQVKYNRIVPMTFQGRIDEPQVRQLLMIAAQHGPDNDVRAESVSLLAAQCKAGNRCDDDTDGHGFRNALLVSLRYDRSPSVRMKALEGLQPYIGEDQKVRDAVLESLMRDPSAEVRTRAIGMLEPVQADSSVRQVLHTVSTQDQNPYIRNASMQVLEGADGIE